jgi:hypothetical protein
VNDATPYAIYRGTTKYLVHEFSEDRPGLWCPLGPTYDRAKAHLLADSLNRDLEEAKQERKAKQVK